MNDTIKTNLKYWNVKVIELADEALFLTEEIAATESKLEISKRRLREIQVDLLPDLLAEVGYRDFERNGHQFKLEIFVSGSFPKEKAKVKTAIQWLKDHNLEEVIKVEFRALFNRGEINVAREAVSRIRDLCKVNILATVHPQTLTALVRKRLRDGDPIAPDVLGVWAGRRMQIKKVEN